MKIVKEIDEKIEDFMQVVDRIWKTKSNDKLNPKIVIPPLHTKLDDINQAILHLLQTKFVFKNEKQIELKKNESISLQIQFFSGNCKSLLGEILKLAKKIAEELSVLKAMKGEVTENQVSRSVS